MRFVEGYAGKLPASDGGAEGGAELGRIRNTLILHSHETDADGREFKREAEAYADWLRARGESSSISIFTSREYWEHSRAESEHRIIEYATGRPPLSRLALFCHGLRSKVQAGWASPTAPSLARTLRTIGASTDLSIPLYACSCGGSDSETGEGSFAAALRTALELEGFRGGRIFSHDCKGHTTRNRAIRIYEIGGEREARLVVDPREKDLWSRLGGFLSDTPDGRWRAADMHRMQLRAEAAKSPPKRPK